MIKKLRNRLLLTFILTLVLFFNISNYSNASSGDIFSKTFYNYKNAYSELLDYLKNEHSDMPLTYTIVDINNDESPELITLNSDVEAIKEFHIYSFLHNNIINLGSIEGGHSVLYEMNNKPYIIRLFGQMGYEVISKVEIVENKIVETEISSREVPPTEEYDKGDIELNFNDYSNKQLLNDYKVVSNSKTSNNEINKDSNTLENLVDFDISNPIVNEDHISEESDLPSECSQYMTILIIVLVSIVAIIFIILFIKLIFKKKK